MATCEVCGNDYEDAMTIERRGESHVFDSFECAIHALAPTCEHCGCRVIGHGIRAGDRTFCFVGEWDSIDMLAAARPLMIGLLDSFRDMLEDLGGNLGVTDPVSGTVVADLP